MPIIAAHRVATVLERAIRAELGGDVGVDTHLDPRRMRVFSGAPVDVGQTEGIAAVIEETAAEFRPPVNVHHFHIQAEDDGLYVSFHCVFNDELPIRKVHDQTVRLENRIYDRLPEIKRLVIHAEPVHHRDDVSDSL
jgi:divalent metal cation (Fe/Co/Zn/Cd) transporter